MSSASASIVVRLQQLPIEELRGAQRENNADNDENMFRGFNRIPADLNADSAFVLGNHAAIFPPHGKHHKQKKSCPAWYGNLFLQADLFLVLIIFV